MCRLLFLPETLFSTDLVYMPLMYGISTYKHSHCKQCRVDGSHFIIFLPLTDCLYSLKYHCNVVYLTYYLQLLFSCYCTSESARYMPPQPLRTVDKQAFLLTLIPILTIFLMQELNSVFALSFFSLVYSKIFFPILFYNLLNAWKSFKRAEY